MSLPSRARPSSSGGGRILQSWLRWPAPIMRSFPGEPNGSPCLAALLKARQAEELRAGQSLCGPHREDLELLLDGQPARVFASQGQQRSVVLSLKMAEAAAAASITGEHPVLLLDDVLSELDDGRKQYLLTRMREKQTFVTSCDDTAFLKTDGEVYRMNGGVLSKA